MTDLPLPLYGFDPLGCDTGALQRSCGAAAPPHWPRGERRVRRDRRLASTRLQLLTQAYTANELGWGRRGCYHVASSDRTGELVTRSVVGIGDRRLDVAG